MKKVLFTVLLSLAAAPCLADLVSRTYTYTDGNTISAAENNTNETTLYTAVNGNLNNANIQTGGIATANLADSAVTTVKIADANVTSAKLAAIVSITSASITNLTGQVTGSPCPTCVGYTASSVTTSINLPATTLFGDMVALTLTPGVWMLNAFGTLNVNNSTTVSEITFGISTTAGNSSAGLVVGDNTADLSLSTTILGTSGTLFPLTVPAYVVTITGNTTYYLKMECTYSSNQPKALGRLTALRIY